MSYSDDVEHSVKGILPPAKVRTLLLELSEMMGAEVLKTHKLGEVGGFRNNGNRRCIEGLSAFFLIQERFQFVCERHGGVPVANIDVDGMGIYPIHQPFMRFEVERGGTGAIVGFASMAEPRELPKRNKSRDAAVKLNRFLSPQGELTLGGGYAKEGDIFICILIARDKVKLGAVREIALGVIDDGYGEYLFYQSVEEFMAGYADEIVKLEPPALKLKKRIASEAIYMESNDNQG